MARDIITRTPGATGGQTPSLLTMNDFLDWRWEENEWNLLDIIVIIDWLNTTRQWNKILCWIRSVKKQPKVQSLVLHGHRIFISFMLSADRQCFKTFHRYWMTSKNHETSVETQRHGEELRNVAAKICNYDWWWWWPNHPSSIIVLRKWRNKFVWNYPPNQRHLSIILLVPKRL